MYATILPHATLCAVTLNLLHGETGQCRVLAPCQFLRDTPPPICVLFYKYTHHFNISFIPLFNLIAIIIVKTTRRDVNFFNTKFETPAAVRTRELYFFFFFTTQSGTKVSRRDFGHHVAITPLQGLTTRTGFLARNVFRSSKITNNPRCTKRAYTYIIISVSIFARTHTRLVPV